MLKSQLNGLTAPKLRIVLVVTMFLLLIISVVAFWFFRSQLEAYATQVQSDTAAANVSTKDVARLKELQQKLEDDKVAVTRAKSIVADSKYYQYQDQIIDDITTFAKNAGVSITSFTFNTDTKNSAASPASGTSVAPQQAPLPAGLKSTSASITLKYPAKYENVMNFIHSIELNLTKMQLSGISMTRLTKGDVQINPITIEVYTR